jgi:anthranilate/para-aminobenzoate synthase component I
MQLIEEYEKTNRNFYGGHGIYGLKGILIMPL